MSLTSKQIKEKLASKGLSEIFHRYRTNDTVEKMRKATISHPDILSNHYNAIDNHTSLNEVFKSASQYEIDLYTIPFWKTKIDEMTKKVKDSARELFYGNADYIISAARMVPGFDWKGLFEVVAPYQNDVNYMRHSYSSIAREYSKTNSSAFKDYVNENIFYTKEKKPAYPVRGLMYSLFVKQGFLTKKTARKIRSDGSEDASMSGLRALTEDLDLYSNSDELLLQFTDSKYEQVIGHLADNLPEHLLPSIMGTEFYWPKRKLEKRLERIEREKIEKRRLAEQETSLFDEVVKVVCGQP
jgi:hypothetical protein